MILRATLAAAAALCLSWTSPVIAAGSPKPLFASDAMLELTLEGPISGMSRRETAKPVAATLKVDGVDSETLPVALTTRGVKRRDADICSFPPLRVAFTKKPGKNSIFKGQNSLKLVTHCRRSDSYQQYVLLEYASYRLYSALTSESFGVRLARINYKSEDGRPILTRLGFFIEDIDDVAARNGQKRLRGVDGISPSQLNPDAAARFAIFQYMISNLDWAMTANVPGKDCCHNARLVGAKGAMTNLTPVPYDFDYAGLVDTPYATPPEGFTVRSVTVRRYRGFCQHNDQAQAIAAEFLTRRASLLGILDQIPQLREPVRRRAADFLGKFFDSIASPAKTAQLLSRCRR